MKSNITYFKFVIEITQMNGSSKSKIFKTFIFNL